MRATIEHKIGLWRALTWLVRLSFLLTLIVIVLGAYTRISDAGLGCPDWPGCFGQLSVPNEHHEIEAANTRYPDLMVEPHKAWLEMIHRYVAATLGLMIAAILFFSIRLARLKFIKLSIALPIGLSILVIAQAALGMWTVTLKLMPIIVMLHLLGGFSIACLLLWLHLRLQHIKHYIMKLLATVPLQTDSSAISTLSSRSHIRGSLQQRDKASPPENPPTQGLKRLGILGLIILIMQIMLGGWTSSNYAALMCTSLPICEGNWWQQLQFTSAFSVLQTAHHNANGSYEFGVLDYASRMTIHVSHRFGALLTAGVLISLALQLIRWHAFSTSTSTSTSTSSRSLHHFRRLGWWLMGLVVIQIGLGIANVLLHLPVILAVAHNFVAALLLLMMVKIHFALRYSERTPQSLCAKQDVDKG
ncbi:heme A synthase [Vibrio sp. S11_S32]|uniref:COX15/CtaA family protein n=1 Tax=Vibrio sp. S11_S32 TaxID=2720225 RepID=UPI001680E844|nr:COX15/CtaA family protein [Vibrio sp. S11_S32]MBD1577446.1 heme A synthase [Vibrio sp. S11_S32]